MFRKTVITVLKFPTKNLKLIIWIADAYLGRSLRHPRPCLVHDIPLQKMEQLKIIEFRKFSNFQQFFENIDRFAKTFHLHRKFYGDSTFLQNYRNFRKIARNLRIFEFFRNSLLQIIDRIPHEHEKDTPIKTPLNPTEWRKKNRWKMAIKRKNMKLLVVSKTSSFFIGFFLFQIVGEIFDCQKKDFLKI